MAKRIGLGKGLGAFFGDDLEMEPIVSHATKNDGAEEIGDPLIQVKPADKNTNENVGNNVKIRDKVATSKNDVARNEKESNKEDHKENDIKDNTEKKDENSGEIYIKISLIEPNREQPRKDFNEELLQELAESIKQYGILQPLLVKKNKEYYEIIAGERRWRAAKIAGLKEVPVIIKDYSKQQTMEIALIENVQREDLNPIEEAMAYKMLIQEFNLRQEEIAERVSKSRTVITNSMRLLKLDERIQSMLVQNQISSGHARALLSIEDKEQQFLIAQKVLSDRLSVREVEKIAKLISNPPKKKEKLQDEERDISFIYHDLEEKMKSIMGTKVIINKKDKNKGRVEIEYYSEAELERIVELIQSIGEI